MSTRPFFHLCLSLPCRGPNKLYIWLDILAGGCGRKVDTELQAAGHKWAPPACVLVSARERVHPCGESAVMHPRRIGSIYLAGSDADRE